MNVLFSQDTAAPRVLCLMQAYPQLMAQTASLGLGTRPGHAYLFSGPAGVGKRTLAWALAARLLGDFSDFSALHQALDRPVWPSVLQDLFSGVHPEMYVFEGGQGGVEDWRALKAKLLLTRLGKGWRVVLITRAQLLSSALSNGILKAVEEPPAGTLFLITADGPVAPTLASRCQRLAMTPLDTHALEKVVHSQPRWEPPPLSPDQHSILLTMSQGCIGRYMRLAPLIDWITQTWHLLNQSRTQYAPLPAPWVGQLEAQDDTPRDVLWYDIASLYLHALARYSCHQDRPETAWGTFGRLDTMTQHIARLWRDYRTMHTDILLTIQAIHATIYATLGNAHDTALFHNADLLRQ